MSAEDPITPDEIREQTIKSIGHGFSFLVC